MKVTTLKIKNVGLVADETIELNKPLIILYGEIRQGKTTILNCVRWVCGGSFPSDIIKHGQKEAEIEMGFEGGSIRREFYVSKKGETKARDVQFIRNGRPVEKPVRELERLINPFLANQDYLRNMGETERKAYFTEMFPVDTLELDTEAYKCEREASDLRAKIKGYGDIDLTSAESVDASELKAKLAAIRADYQRAIQEHQEHNQKVDTADAKAVREYNAADLIVQRHNATVDRYLSDLEISRQTIARLKKELADAEAEIAVEEKWIANNPKKDSPKAPTPLQRSVQPQPPDTADLETQIQNAAAQNVRAEQYAKNKARAAQREADEKRLAEIEKREREIKKEKVAKLKGISESCGIAGLAFDESGMFTYEGTQAGMLSTSQIMRLSSALSALYPEGFGIELLDRGESLGRAIFDYVQHAEKNKSTVLATVVGERPATVPEKVGVFVVQDGVVFKNGE